MSANESEIRRYKRLPYSVSVHLTEPERGEAYFIAEIKELPGLEAGGATPTEARYHLQQAFDDYLRAKLEWGEDIPAPSPWQPGDAVDAWRRKRGRTPGDREETEVHSTSEENVPRFDRTFVDDPQRPGNVRVPA